MEWLKKLLESNELSAEQIEAILRGAEKELQKYIPKHRFDEVNEAKKQLEADIKERDEQLGQLKKSVGDNEELKKQIETLQNENKTKDEQYQAKIKELQVNTAIKLALAGEAHDPELVANLLDKTIIELGEDGAIKAGLEDQVKALRESKAFLFVEKEEGNPATQFKGLTPADGKEQRPLTEQGQFEARLKEAREKNNTLEAIKIKQEAAEQGFTLI